MKINNNNEKDSNENNLKLENFGDNNDDINDSLNNNLGSRKASLEDQELGEYIDDNDTKPISIAVKEKVAEV